MVKTIGHSSSQSRLTNRFANDARSRLGACSRSQKGAYYGNRSDNTRRDRKISAGTRTRHSSRSINSNLVPLLQRFTSSTNWLGRKSRLTCHLGKSTGEHEIDFSAGGAAVSAHCKTRLTSSRPSSFDVPPSASSSSQKCVSCLLHSSGHPSAYGPRSGFGVQFELHQLKVPQAQLSPYRSYFARLLVRTI